LSLLKSANILDNAIIKIYYTGDDPPDDPLILSLGCHHARRRAMQPGGLNKLKNMSGHY
jgi:hypothetical protein